MARGEVINSIHDLQFEWASNHANKSIRDFLINVKGFTPRRYSYIMEQVPAIQWNTRRQEIQNTILSAKQESLLKNALEANNQIFRTAKLGAFYVLRDLSTKGEEQRLSSKELLDYMKSLETTQAVAMRALGINREAVKHHPQKIESTDRPNLFRPSFSSGPSPADQLSYEDVMTLIEIEREKKRLRSLSTPRTQVEN